MVSDKQLKEWEALARGATGGPWAWEQVGEKSNGFVVGGACDEDGTPIEGLIEDPEDFVVDEVIRRDFVGEKEGATVNYGDAAFIAASRTAVVELIAEVRRLRTALELCSKNDSSPYGTLARPREIAERALGRS